MRRTALLAVLVLVAATVVPAAVANAAVPRPTTWSIQSSPNRQQVSNFFSDVSCAGESPCIAVGAYRSDAPPPPPPATTVAGTLIETFSGVKWSTTPSPGQGSPKRFFAVSCPTATRCYAVGENEANSQPFIATSTGGSWVAMPSPHAGDASALGGISCPDEAHCVAVGSSITHASPKGRTVIMTLAGGTWTLTPSPNRGSDGLSAVSCRTATQCVAVGSWSSNSPTRTLALQLSGGQWTQMPMPNTPAGSNQLDGVVCTSGTRCTAVGHTVTAEDAPLRTLVETLSAGTWLVVPSPNRGNASSELFGIDCNDATHCIAVGAADSSAPLVEQLSGSTWKLMTTPARDGFSTLNGVDCVSSSVCVAVGYSSGGPASNAARTLVLRSS